LVERALLYRDAIDRYATLHLQTDILSSEDWAMVEVIAGWLKLFRDTTTRMSARDKTTISSVYAVFLRLQDDVRQNLRATSSGMSAKLKAGLIGAHEKLAEYFKKSDASPFYMWAACMLSLSQSSQFYAHLYLIVLDPRVTFNGALRAARTDPELRSDVLNSKIEFERYLVKHYPDELPSSSSKLPANTSDTFFDLFTDNANDVSPPQQELERFFALRAERYDACPDPVRWWASHQSAFPRLARMARDILSIPGMPISDRQFSHLTCI
jgi:hypothetical protein